MLMSNVTAPVVAFPDSELVLGVVAPAGTDRDAFLARLEAHLRGYRYGLNLVRLSDFLRLVEPPDSTARVDDSTEALRLDTLMRAGSALRGSTGAEDILAQFAVSRIGNSRIEGRVIPRTAHVLWSLKHPDEVSLLQQVYGSGFFLIGLYSSEEERIQYLQDRWSMSRADAEERVGRDRDEALPHGQRTRDTFQLADVFVPVSGPECDRHLQRFLDLVFGSPSITPEPHEHAMFLAYAASVRSGALSRQVGAVVVSEEGDIIGAGANDAPRAGGGQYWPGADDQRDVATGFDSNAREREKIAASVVRVLRDRELLSDPALSAEATIHAALARSRLWDITEYGRDVHAEMEAILSCVRAGVSVRGATLFTTTFPCHNCAKHIVDAGISRVVFVEPYPKSKALELHSDALSLQPEPPDGRVQFSPFIGIGPRRYFDLFSLRLGQAGILTRKRGAALVPWDRGTSSPRVSLKPMSYIQLEAAVNRLLSVTFGYNPGAGEEGR
jgi:deoxycytidylate deaminase